jgi:hypothetical protein
MHEFELGVWKALFIHLLRMLNAADKALVHELDRRYVNRSLRSNIVLHELTIKGTIASDRFLVLVVILLDVSQTTFLN